MERCYRQSQVCRRTEQRSAKSVFFWSVLFGLQCRSHGAALQECPGIRRGHRLHLDPVTQQDHSRRCQKQLSANSPRSRIRCKPPDLDQARLSRAFWESIHLHGSGGQRLSPAVSVYSITHPRISISSGFSDVGSEVAADLSVTRYNLDPSVDTVMSR